MYQKGSGLVGKTCALPWGRPRGRFAPGIHFCRTEIVRQKMGIKACRIFKVKSPCHRIWWHKRFSLILHDSCDENILKTVIDEIYETVFHTKAKLRTVSREPHVCSYLSISITHLRNSFIFRGFIFVWPATCFVLSWWILLDQQPSGRTWG